MLAVSEKPTEFQPSTVQVASQEDTNSAQDQPLILRNRPLASCCSSYGKIFRPNAWERSLMRLRIGRAGGSSLGGCRGGSRVGLLSGRAYIAHLLSPGVSWNSADCGQRRWKQLADLETPSSGPTFHGKEPNASWDNCYLTNRRVRVLKEDDHIHSSQSARRPHRMMVATHIYSLS